MEISGSVLPSAYMGFAQTPLPLMLMGISHSDSVVFDKDLVTYMCQTVDAFVSYFHLSSVFMYSG